MSESVNRPQDGRGAAGQSDSGARHDTAVQRLADQVVLRLADRLHPDGAEWLRTPVTVEAFLAALLDGDDTLAITMARQTHAGQGSVRHVYFTILGPAATRLGDMWQRDEISFLQLTLAAGRVFSIMRSLRREMAGRSALDQRAGALALFASVPGEEHTMGLTMAADLFRERGWQVDLRAGSSYDTLIAEAQATAFPVIGLSAGHPWSVPALTRTVVGLRAAAPASRIVLSGNLLRSQPEIGDLLAVDFASTDFDALLETCEGYLQAA